MSLSLFSPFFFHALLSVWVLCLSLCLSFGCQEFRGIGNRSSDSFRVGSLSNVPYPSLTQGPIAGNRPIVIEIFAASETPIQARLPIAHWAMHWNVLSSYESIPIEFFGRRGVSEERKFCETRNNTRGNTDMFRLHLSVAWWYSTYYYDRGFYPTVAHEMASLITSYGLDPYICDGHNNYVTNGCDDTSTPWGLAYEINSEFYDWAINDGWNADGSYNREYNRIPYSDFREGSKRYVPKNDPWDLKYTHHWQPLLESDDYGFLYHQEHVVPHVGYTAKSYVFTDAEFCQRSKHFKENVELDYDYDEEMELVFDRMANLTDLQKMEIEYFDVKNNLGQLVTQYALTYHQGIVDRMEWIVHFVVYLLNTYETVIAVWKEKVDYDRVRPTSIIHKLLGNEFVTTYAGVSQDGESFGTQTFEASNFEPYIRTMPHAEYPSGSACICKSWANAMIEFWGTDDVTAVMGSQGLQVTFPAFSSLYEPLSTPREDITVHYYTWSEIGQRCSESRLEGGMHFTASVPNGEQLCQDIGVRVAKTVKSLFFGETPEYIVDVENTNRIERTCCPNESGSSRSSRSSSSSSSSEDSSSGRGD